MPNEPRVIYIDKQLQPGSHFRYVGTDENGCVEYVEEFFSGEDGITEETLPTGGTLPEDPVPAHMWSCPDDSTGHPDPTPGPPTRPPYKRKPLPGEEPGDD